MHLSNSHPYWFIANLVRSDSSIEKLYFSHYSYTPQSFDDERHTFQAARKDFLSPEWMEHVLNNTPSSKELAIHSNVDRTDGRSFHIPMIDMATFARAHVLKLQNILANSMFGRFQWFDSGRSFHGYGESLVDGDEWRRLMGILLLSNERAMMPIVDTRWVGHRLMAGYSALRWTRNTHYYISQPANIGGY